MFWDEESSEDILMLITNGDSNDYVSDSDSDDDYCGDDDNGCDHHGHDDSNDDV